MSYGSGRQERRAAAWIIALFLVVSSFWPASTWASGASTTLLTTAIDGEFPNSDSFFSALTPDARFALFQSTATNLVPGDTNGVADIFVKDRLSGAVERVSIADDEAQANGQSGSTGYNSDEGAAISENGRYIAFVSTADNLIPGDFNERIDIFVRDRLLGTTRRVSVDSAGGEANGPSADPAMSADGRSVVFESYATNLAPIPPAEDGGVGRTPNVFVRDLATGTTRIVNVRSGRSISYCSDPVISGNGRFVFAGCNGSYRFDLGGGPPLQIGNGLIERTTFDGRYSVGSTSDSKVPEDTNNRIDVYIVDWEEPRWELISKSTAGILGDGTSGGPSISHDGRYVVFASSATTLSGDTNGVGDVYLRDRFLGSTERISVRSNGAQLHSDSGVTIAFGPTVSSDGRYVLFWSLAAAELTGTASAQALLFVRDRGVAGPPPAGRGAVVSVAASIDRDTPMWTLPVRFQLSNVACPAIMNVAFAGEVRDIPVCTAGQVPPTSVQVDYRVFPQPPATTPTLEPNSLATLSASIQSSADLPFSGVVTVPPAPVWVGVGDSYTSGHHQDADNPGCFPSVCYPDSLRENDVSFSWVTRAATALNERLAVPDRWRITPAILARSGARAQDYVRDGVCAGCGQLSAMTNLLRGRSESWNVIGLTGGANDADFAAALFEYYTHPTVFWTTSNGKPWNESVRAGCPDTDAIYDRLQIVRQGVSAALNSVIATARRESPAIRIVDVNYPYVVSASSPCFEDQPIRVGGPQHGVKSVIDALGDIHTELTGIDVRIDLRSLFGASDLSKLQLTRYYGYPHVNGGGQDAIAADVATRLAAEAGTS